MPWALSSMILAVIVLPKWFQLSQPIGGVAASWAAVPTENAKRTSMLEKKKIRAFEVFMRFLSLYTCRENDWLRPFWGVNTFPPHSNLNAASHLGEELA